MPFNSSHFPKAALAALAFLASSGFIVNGGSPIAAAAANRTRRNPERYRVSEALLALKVRDRLLSDLRDDALSIFVEARGQAIILTGEVKRQASLGLAETVTRSVDGVTQVNNKLTRPRGEDAPRAVAFVTLYNGHAVADALMETRIRRTLLERFGGGALKIAVEANDGIVSLSGSAPTGAQSDQALRAAREISGVREVRDMILISPRPADSPG